MKSKKQLLEIIKREGGDRFHYLNELFRNLPEEIAKEIMYKEVKKNENLLVAGNPAETVYIILKGHVVGLDHQKLGRVYSFMDFTKMYIVGDFEVFAEYSEYGVSICTTEDCKLLKISSNNYLRWIRYDENALFLRLNNILTTLTFERKMDRKYLMMGCKERLTDFFVKMYEKEIIDKDRSEKEMSNKAGRFKVLKTQNELADKIGFNVRSIQRSIAALEKDDLISTESGKVIISQEQYIRLKQYNEGK